MIKNPSPEQLKFRQWFKSGHGNLIGRARAGTGKTTTIIDGVEVAPEQRILLAAFNKSIANELQARVKSDRVQVKTLHGLGYAFVRKMWFAVTVDVDVDGKRALDLARAVCEPMTSHRVLQLLARIHSKLREVQPHETSSEDALAIMNRFDLLPDDEMEIEEGVTDRWLAIRASKAVEIAKKRSPIIDFADMIFLPVVHRAMQPWFDMVVVDEAQDMTAAQLELAIGSCRRGGRIAIVGDDRQAIYGFRGADSGSLDRLKKTLHAVELGLTTTYRCPKRVVEVASQFVPDFRAAPLAPEGIVESCGDDRMVALAEPGDFILSRTNAPLIKICMTILRQGRKAYIRGRDIGKGILALVDRQGARDLVDLEERLRVWHSRESTRAMQIVDDDAAQARLDFVDDQLGVCLSLVEDVGSLKEFRVKLETGFSDAGGAAVMCSTVHKAKGLESENVFLLEGTFRGIGKEDEVGEEQNIVYVAVTRSKQRLWWVSGFEKKARKREAA